jgi:hypothetical protein
MQDSKNSLDVKHFYESNLDVLNHPINCTFEKILWMNEGEFRLWTKALRKVIVDIWDNKGIPPKLGRTEDEIIEQFNQLMGFPVHEFEAVDENTGQKDCIRNTANLGTSCVNQWFPNMLKTKINYKDSGEGTSIYDLTAKKEYFESQYKALYRNLKKDGFYNYSIVVEKNTAEHGVFAETPTEWVTRFEKEQRQYGTHDYFLEERDADDEYTGNSLELREKYKSDQFLIFSSEELKKLTDVIPAKCLSNIKEIQSDCKYRIRYFKRGQKLFPPAFKSWKVTIVQQAVNFPVLTAKWIYEKYTEEFKDDEVIYVWDCSSGWAGRIVGAMSVRNDRQLHYIGTDPNSENWITPGYSKYEDVANFYNTKSSRIKGFWPQTNTYEMFCTGSEMMQFEPAFQKYKGKISVAGTSSPYFNREQYSEEDTQSYKKFSSYDLWRDGFLRPTLETIMEWLRPGGYVWWNTANLKVGKNFLPLEEDSYKILTELGAKHLITWKMCMNPMPGAGRRNEDGESTFKNHCKVNGKLVKYEPIMVFRKP